MANNVKLETLIHGSSHLGAMVAMCLPLCLDLNVGMDVDVERLRARKAR